LNFTWSIRKLIVVDPNDVIVRLDNDKCIELSCLFDAKELLTSDAVDPELRFFVLKLFNSISVLQFC